MLKEILVQDFFYNSQSIKFVTDTKGKLILLNKKAESLFDLAESDLKNENLKEVLNTKSKNFVQNHIKESLKINESLTSVVELNGTTEPFFKLTTQLSTDKKYLYHGMVQLTPAELESSKALYQTMAEFSGDAITVIENHTFTYISPAATQIFGFTPEEILGQPLQTYYLRIHEDDATEFYRKIDESILKKEKSQRYAYRFRTKAGEVKWIEDYVQRKFDKQGNEMLAIINSRDITENKNTELALLKSEAELRAANAAKDKFFSIIAHDLKSPFSALIGFSELLITQKESISEEKKDLFLSHIYRSAKSTFSLLENLLLWSRVQTDRIKFEPLTYNIKDSIEQNIHILSGSAENKQIKIINTLTNDILVFTDPNMINTVLRNLLSNAVKFTPHGGKITIAAENLKQKSVKITVTDTGVGISEENIRKILKIDESFTTVGTDKEKGSGLGLILCNEFVTINGGTMTIDSKPNVGSSFSFTLKLK